MVTHSDVVRLRLIQQKDTNRFVKRGYIECYAFLYEQENSVSWWSWENYNGPISRNIRDQLRRLASQELINEREQPTYGGEIRLEYRLTQKGEDHLCQDESSFRGVDKIINEWGNLPLSNLIDEICSSERRFSLF